MTTSRRKQPARGLNSDAFERIERLALIALMSDDDLVERLVLKGGNAIKLAGLTPVRRSLDLDFSIDGDLGDLGTHDQIRDRIERLLQEAFASEDLHVFDVRFVAKPPAVDRDELEGMWGGYQLTFKVMDQTKASALPELDDRRRQAIPFGDAHQRSFEIDFSKHEYCGQKILADLEGYRIYVYPASMLVCEKIRAICQQMPIYRKSVASQSSRPRARDFFDVEYISKKAGINFDSDEFWQSLVACFAAKRVPLSLLGSIRSECEFHRSDFASVTANVSAEHPLRDFEYYVEWLTSSLSPLEPRWKVDPPSS